MNYLLKGNPRATLSYLDTGGDFLTKPEDIANHLNNYFIKKIDRIKGTVLHKNKSLATRLIDQIMAGKECIFEFKNVSVSKIELMLMTYKNKPPGVDELDGNLLKPIASFIAPMVMHIINQSINLSKCPQAWKISKIVPIPKNKRMQLSESNSRPISLLPILSKTTEKIMYEQIQSYFTNNCLFSNFQHAYREKHSTATALTQMVDDWYKAIEQRKIIGAVFFRLLGCF